VRKNHVTDFRRRVAAIAASLAVAMKGCRSLSKHVGIAAITALMMQSSFAWANLSLEDYKAAKKDPKQSVSLRSYIYMD
jgi:hypothetical protein